MKHFNIAFCILSLLALNSAFAQPDLSKPLGPTIADHGSKFYEFQTFKIDSEDAQRHYKISVAIPKKESLEKGFPVIYMLDGNAALASMNDDLFSRLSDELPVIVAIGYDTELRFDVQSRAFDYTPARPDGQEPETEKGRGRRGGGADVFAELIKTKIKPKVEETVSIDKNRQAIWGHSYGGLFVLNALFRHGAMFQNYIAADPSIWWEEGVILKIEPSMETKENVNFKSRNLAVLVGRGGVRPSRQRPEGDSETVKRVMDSRRTAPSNAAPDLCKRLESKLCISTFCVFEGLSHGPMLPASIESALKFCVHPEAFSSDTVDMKNSEFAKLRQK